MNHFFQLEKDFSIQKNDSEKIMNFFRIVEMSFVNILIWSCSIPSLKNEFQEIRKSDVEKQESLVLLIYILLKGFLINQNFSTS